MMAFGSKCLRKADVGKVLTIKKESQKTAARRGRCKYLFSVAKNIGN